MNARKLHPFAGGIHPEGHKEASCARPIAVAPLLTRYIVPLRQHIGSPAEAIVKAGDRVLRGQMIGVPSGRVSTAVHAPTSGIVSAIEQRSIAHVSGLTDLCIVIEADGRDEAIEMQPIDWQEISHEQLVERIQALGLAGLGGAVFPSHIKLGLREHQKVPTLILNGAECEPWITCDDMLMRERAAEILDGAAVMRHALQADEVLIGIEDNKPEAIAAMQAAAKACGFPVEVVVVPTRYPTGGGKQLTQLLTGKETPSGKLSTDIGIQVFNVGTAYALYRAVRFGEPMISRTVTLTGAVAVPQNFEVRIGTPICDLLEFAGGTHAACTGQIVGGPMMGFDLADSEAPVVKGINCVISKSPDLFPPTPAPMPCIRCGQCARACPVELQPFELYWYSRAKDFGKVQGYNLFDCIECGCCSYVCPSHIPLVNYYRFAKSEIWAREHEKTASDIARERHEFHIFRLEREKREKAEKLGKKASDRLDSGAADGDDAESARKKAILQAAIERAQKAKEGVAPKNTENLAADKQQEIDTIEARRKLAASSQGEGTPSAPPATTPPAETNSAKPETPPAENPPESTP